MLRKKWLCLYALVCLLGAQAWAKGKDFVRPISWDKIKHVIVVVLENGNPDEAFAQPYMNELTRRGAFFSNFRGEAHPSQPNYIAMVGGSTFGVATNANVTVFNEHLGDLLDRANLSWKTYVENYPGNCYLGASLNDYVRKHFPFLSFENVQRNPVRCAQRIFSSDTFFTDIANKTLPAFSFYVPNQRNNGHDTGLRFADNWLKTVFSPIINNQEIMKDTLLVLTFDEDDYFHFNRIYTVMLGGAVKPGIRSNQSLNHYNLLRTIEEIFKLGHLGRFDKDAKIISDIWMN